MVEWSPAIGRLLNPETWLHSTSESSEFKVNNAVTDGGVLEGGLWPKAIRQADRRRAPDASLRSVSPPPILKQRLTGLYHREHPLFGSVAVVSIGWPPLHVLSLQYPFPALLCVDPRKSGKRERSRDFENRSARKFARFSVR